MKPLIRSLILAGFVVILGLIVLGPNTVAEWVVGIVSLATIGLGPSMLHPKFGRHWAGAALGLVFGLPVAAVFQYWLWLLPMTAFGWSVGLISKGLASKRLDTNNGNEKPLKGFASVSLAGLLSIVTLAGTMFALRSQQNETLSEYADNGIEYSQTYTGRPKDCKIIVNIESGKFSIGELESTDYSVAAKGLRERINTLLLAGTAPSEISIKCEAANVRDRNRIWLLREAFDNVQGQQLNVFFN